VRSNVLAIALAIIVMLLPRAAWAQGGVPPALPPAPAGCDICHVKSTERSVEWLYVVTGAGKLDGTYCESCKDKLRCSQCGKSAYKTASTEKMSVKLAGGKSRNVSVSTGTVPDSAKVRCAACVSLEKDLLSMPKADPSKIKIEPKPAPKVDPPKPEPEPAPPPPPPEPKPAPPPAPAPRVEEPPPAPPPPPEPSNLPLFIGVGVIVALALGVAVWRIRSEPPPPPTLVFRKPTPADMPSGAPAKAPPSAPAKAPPSAPAKAPPSAPAKAPPSSKAPPSAPAEGESADAE
jgi:hypothetical protein